MMTGGEIDFSLDLRRWRREDAYGFAVAMQGFSGDDSAYLRDFSSMLLIPPAANENE
jgi:hypothetical protein|tara:strand:- start:512 stop:682 length:171 start_codon:yes stop_codon:yes gene_type:complete